ncbi:MaoC/PaaZ C-terminal domain-containing protein [Streptomyces sp. NPDC002851]
MTDIRLAAAPGLVPLLARGALLSPLKRVRPDATAPGTRLVLPGARARADRLDAYRQVCGFTRGPSADAVLPVTYPHVMGFPLAMRLMAARDFPLPLLGLVHTSIEIEQSRALPADAELELTVYAEELRPHRRGTEAVVLTRAELDGEPVWESRSTYLARHSRTSESAAPSVEPENDGGEEPELPTLTEWRLPTDLGRRYGAASGDRNPIHLHPLTARAFGFPRAIAHGMWTVARCLAEYGAQERVRVRADFRAPVFLPGRVTYAAKHGRFELRDARRPEKLHVSGEVTALAP